MMVRTYKRKRDKQKNEENFKKAIHEVMNKHKKLRCTAKKYSLNPSSLYYRILRAKRFAETGDKAFSLYSRRVFTPEEESTLGHYFITYSNMNYGISYDQMRELAYVYAKIVDCQVPASWEKTNIAGKDWLENFLKRINIDHAIVRSKSSPTNPVLTESPIFCSTYERAIELCQSDPRRIYNLCRIEVDLDVPDENEEQMEAQNMSITLCLVGSADGDIIPPVLVLPLLHVDPSLLPYLPPGALCLPNTPTAGLLTIDHFIPILKHLQKHTKCTKKDPITLLVNHSVSRCLCTVEISAFCQKSGIMLVAFPLHWKKSQQPIASTVLTPFKKTFSTNQNNLQEDCPTLLHNLTALMTASYLTSFTETSLISGFQKSHLWPYSKQEIIADNELVIDKEILLYDKYQDIHLEPSVEQKPGNPMRNKLKTVPAKKKVTNGLDTLRIKWKTRRLEVTDDDFVLLVCGMDE